MILSIQQLFSDAQAITATAVSTNQIDLGVPGSPPYDNNQLNQDIGKGNPVPILIQVVEDFDAATSITVTLEVGATTALGTVRATESILLADLVAGKQTFMQYLPQGIDEQYLGVRYTVVGSAPTVGKITAGISMGNQSNFTGA